MLCVFKTIIHCLKIMKTDMVECGVAWRFPMRMWGTDTQKTNSLEAFRAYVAFVPLFCEWTFDKKKPVSNLAATAMQACAFLDAKNVVFIWKKKNKGNLFCLWKQHTCTMHKLEIRWNQLNNTVPTFWRAALYIHCCAFLSPKCHNANHAVTALSILCKKAFTFLETK